MSNSFIFKARVFNYSGDFPFLWDEIVLPVKYGSDWKRARQMLRGIVDEVLVGYHLFTRILEELDKSENQIRLASATFEVVSGSTLDVRLSPPPA